MSIGKENSPSLEPCSPPQPAVAMADESSVRAEPQVASGQTCLPYRDGRPPLPCDWILEQPGSEVVLDVERIKATYEAQLAEQRKGGKRQVAPIVVPKFINRQSFTVSTKRNAEEQDEKQLAKDKGKRKRRDVRKAIKRLEKVAEERSVQYTAQFVDGRVETSEEEEERSPANLLLQAEAFRTAIGDGVWAAELGQRLKM